MILLLIIIIIITIIIIIVYYYHYYLLLLSLLLLSLSLLFVVGQNPETPLVKTDMLNGKSFAIHVYRQLMLFWSKSS